jgi:hypothetical protein
MAVIPVHVSDARHNSKDTSGARPHLQQRRSTSCCNHE